MPARGTHKAPAGSSSAADAAAAAKAAEDAASNQQASEQSAEDDDDEQEGEGDQVEEILDVDYRRLQLKDPLNARRNAPITLHARHGADALKAQRPAAAAAPSTPQVAGSKLSKKVAAQAPKSSGRGGGQAGGRARVRGGRAGGRGGGRDGGFNIASSTKGAKVSIFCQDCQDQPGVRNLVCFHAVRGGPQVRGE